MKIMKKSSCDYQMPTVVIMETALEGVLCLSEQSGFFDGSAVENVGREEFEW